VSGERNRCPAGAASRTSVTRRCSSSESHATTPSDSTDRQLGMPPSHGPCRSRKTDGRLLDEMAGVTDYHRKYAIRRMRGGLERVLRQAQESLA
jgi:hypothetical protein